MRGWSAANGGTMPVIINVPHCDCCGFTDEQLKRIFFQYDSGLMICESCIDFATTNLSEYRRMKIGMERPC